MIDLTPADKALGVKKNQNSSFWQKKLIANNYGTKRDTKIIVQPSCSSCQDASQHNYVDLKTSRSKFDLWSSFATKVRLDFEGSNLSFLSETDQIGQVDVHNT